MKTTNLSIAFILILALTLVTIPGVFAAWADTGLATQTVDGCNELNTTGAIYTLNASVGTVLTENCFDINADNITLNLNGFNITGDYANETAKAISMKMASGYNITINGGYGRIQGWNTTAVYLQGLNNSVIKNLIIRNNSEGLRLYTSDANEFYNITSIYNTNDGIVVYAGSDENTFNNINSSYNGYDGIDLSLVSLLPSDMNGFTGVTTSFNGNNGIYVDDCSDNLFMSVISNNNTNTGIMFFTTGTGSSGNYLIDVSTFNNNVGLQLTKTTNTIIYNLQSYTNTGSEVYSANWAAATDNNLIYKDTAGLTPGIYGQIAFATLSANIDGDLRYGLTRAVQITFNNASFDSTKASALNTSATISLYGLPTNMYQPRIYKDAAVCTDCTAFPAGLNAGNVQFDVISWSSYSVRGGTAPTCTAFTQTMTYLIPGFMVLAILIAGGVVFAIGFQRNDIKTLIASFVVIIVGLVFVQIISGIVVTTC